MRRILHQLNLIPASFRICGVYPGIPISSSLVDKMHYLGQIYEKNMAAYAAALAEQGGGYVQHDIDAVLTIYPYTFWSNGVTSPRFTEENVQERINEVLAVFRRYKREVWFHVGPSSSPSNLTQYLKARNLWNFHNRPFMVCELEDLITGYQLPAGITIHTIEDYAIFQTHQHPIHGLVTTPRKRHIFETYRKLDKQAHRKHWMFIADKQNIPVGVTIVYIDDNIAGIYDVEVQSPYRGQGIGTALLQHVCMCARDAGASVATLAASEQGSKFYPRFGFKVVGRYPTYYYSIKKQKLDAERFNERW